MIILPLLVVLLGVGVVAAVRHRRTLVVSPDGTRVDDRHAVTISPIGCWSLVVLAAAVVLWLLTRSTLPLSVAASVGGIAFLLAIVAVVRSHDRSPLLLLPLVFVPLAAAATAAFVLLQ